MSGNGVPGESSELGGPIGKFSLEEVFEFRWAVGIVLAGRVLEGEVTDKCLLRLPDGRLLKARAMERRGERVKRAGKGEFIGIVVEGLEWKPTRRDLEPYKTSGLAREIKKELKRRYSYLPKELAKQVVEREARLRLEQEIEKRALTAISS